MVEGLSLIDAVMPDIVATRQNQQNQQKQQLIKSEPPETNGGEETKPGEIILYFQFSDDKTHATRREHD